MQIYKGGELRKTHRVGFQLTQLYIFDFPIKMSIFHQWIMSLTTVCSPRALKNDCFQQREPREDAGRALPDSFGDLFIETAVIFDRRDSFNLLTELVDQPFCIRGGKELQHSREGNGACVEAREKRHDELR